MLVLGFFHMPSPQLIPADAHNAELLAQDGLYARLWTIQAETVAESTV